MNKNVTELFCFVDDYCKIIDKNFANRLLFYGKKPTKVPEIKYSEIITIILLYQQSRYENFKSFYQYYLKLLHKSEFPTLPSYDRFIALKPRVLWYLAILLQWLCEQAKETGINYVFLNFLNLVLLQLLFITLYFYSIKKCIFGNKNPSLLQKEIYIKQL